MVFLDANLHFSIWSLSEPPDIRNWFSSYVYESPEVDTIQDFILPDHEKELDDKVYTNACSSSVEPQNLRNSLGTSFIHDNNYEHQTASKVLLIDLVIYFSVPFQSPFLYQFFVKSCFRCRVIECTLEVKVEP